MSLAVMLYLPESVSAKRFLRNDTRLKYTAKLHGIYRFESLVLVVKKIRKSHARR